MKLSEALLLKSDLVKRNGTIVHSFVDSGRIVRGSQADQDMNKLLQEFYETEKKIQDITLQINKTNAVSIVKDGKTLIEFITLKKTTTETLQKLERIEMYSKPMRELREKMETWFDSTINLTELRTEIKNLKNKIREYELVIQTANWTLDLVE